MKADAVDRLIPAQQWMSSGSSPWRALRKPTSVSTCSGARRGETFRRLENVMEGELEMVGVVDAGKAAMRCFRPEQAHHMADLVLADEALDGGEWD